MVGWFYQGPATVGVGKPKCDYRVRRVSFGAVMDERSFGILRGRIVHRRANRRGNEVWGDGR